MDPATVHIDGRINYVRKKVRREETTCIGSLIWLRGNWPQGNKVLIVR